jgi:hypothetical protein
MKPIRYRSLASVFVASSGIAAYVAYPLRYVCIGVTFVHLSVCIIILGQQGVGVEAITLSTPAHLSQWVTRILLIT